MRSESPRASKYLANFVDENRKEFILVRSQLARSLACLGDPEIVIDPRWMGDAEKHVIVVAAAVAVVRVEQKLSRFCTFAVLSIPSKLTNLPLPAFFPFR